MAEEELVEPFKEEKLVGGCISKKIWDRICASAPDFENATLEEIEARLDPNFVPEGWLDPPTPPKKKLKLSLNRKKTTSISELSALRNSSLRNRDTRALRVYERTSEVQEKSAGQCIQSGASFDPISSIEDKENSNPVPSKQVSMPSAGPTSSYSGTGVPRALQQFSGLTGCTFNFYQS